MAKLKEKAMEKFTGVIDLNICDTQPFINMLPKNSSYSQTLKGKITQVLKHKRLNVSTDGYITEVNGTTQFDNFLDKTLRTKSKIVYISHIIHKDGITIDKELDTILSTTNIFTYNKIVKYRMKRLIAGHKNSGTAIHSHSRACFVNLYGKKKWFLAKPTTKNEKILEEFKYDINNKKIVSVKDWFKEKSELLINQLEESELINLEENEILYIPDGYYHAVLNLETTLGIAFSWEKKYQKID